MLKMTLYWDYCKTVNRHLSVLIVVEKTSSVFLKMLTDMLIVIHSDYV